MQIPNRRLIRLLLIAICASFVLLNVLAYFHAHSMMHFYEGEYTTEKPEEMTLLGKAKILLTGVKLSRPESIFNYDDSTRSFVPVRITVNDSVTLGAAYRSKIPQSPLVILHHGYRADKSSLLKEAELFQELGYAVLLVDFRGSGESSESYTTVGYFEADDVLTAYNYARDILNHDSIILFGQSMGAAALLRAIDVYGIEPEAIIVESVFDRMDNTVKHRFEAMSVPSFPASQLLIFWGGFHMGFDAFSNNPVDFAKSVNCPALFLHGTNDSRALLSEGRNVYNAVTTDKIFIEFDNTAHEALADKYPDKWKSVIKEFLSGI